MRAYQAALAAAPIVIGAAGWVPLLAAAIVGWTISRGLRGLSRGRQLMAWAAILERFRGEAHGAASSIALLPRKFVVVLLDTMEPFAARNWLKATSAR